MAGFNPAIHRLNSWLMGGRVHGPAVTRMTFGDCSRQIGKTLATARVHDLGMRFGYVYILASKPFGTLYIGVTNDLARRVFDHKRGSGSQFTKRYGVTMLVWFEQYATVPEAIQRETSLKRWKRDWKIDLVNKTNPEWRDLYSTLI